MEDWTKEWQEGECVMDADMIQWLKDLPKNIRHLLLKFPPSCLVKATRNLLCPARNEVAVVNSYIEPDAKNPEGLVSVRSTPDATLAVQCRPEWLEVVGYYKDITPDVIKLLLEDIKQ